MKVPARYKLVLQILRAANLCRKLLFLIGDTPITS